MPWHISKQDDRFCVVKDGTDETVACHDTEQEAKDHMAAMYANVPDAAKAGAAISRANMTRIQSMHDMAKQMGAQCDMPGHDDTPIGKMAFCPHCGQPQPSAKAGLLDIDASTATPYASMKAIGDRLIEVKVAYYGHKAGKDSHGEYFSPNTDFDPENFPAPPLLYYHGFDANGKKMGKPAVTGKFNSRRTGSDGHYLTYKLKNTKFADLQWDSAQKGACVVSPGTIGHLIRKQPDGELTYWPLAEISAWDYAANRAPANLHSVAAPVIKALYLAEGLTPPTVLETAASETPEAPGDGASEQAQPSGVDFQTANDIIAREVAAMRLAIRKGR